MFIFIFNASRLISLYSVTSAVSTISADSDFSDMDELNVSMTSSLSVPRLYNEKRKVSKTGSYPLEQLQKPIELSNEHTTKEIGEKDEETDIHDWWLNEVETA